MKIKQETHKSQPEDLPLRSDVIGAGGAVDIQRPTAAPLPVSNSAIYIHQQPRKRGGGGAGMNKEEFGSLPPVLDACCGGRAFWFDKADSRALFVDKREGVFPIVRQTPRSPVVVKPNWCGSFTAMPFPSDTFYHIIFDPPHIIESSASGNVAKTYGVLRGEWREELRQGFAECFRVLRPGGTLIFKWNEIAIPIADILALTPERPLYGHRSGKASKTHWVAFLKPNARLDRSETAGGKDCHE